MELMTDQRFRKTLKYIRALFFISLIGMVLSILFIAGVFIYAKVLGPPPLSVPQSTLYYSADGEVIGESNNGQKRYWVSYDKIAEPILEATVAIEDRKFYDHNGFDFKRIIGAALADVKALSKVQGASTITQQYARNLYLVHDKTWKRKLTEAFYTIRLEMNYSKKEILEGYINTIYYGHGAYGVQAASQYYFGKNASDLTLAESSLLAGVPKGPGIYSPFISLEKAKKRQKIILNTMVQNHYIDKKEAESAIQAPLKFVGKYPHAKKEIAPYYQDAVRNALKNQLHLDDRTIALGGLRVYTTIDLEQQKIAEETISKLVAKDSEIEVALVSMNPKNGYVKAMVGGRNYEKSPFNRAIQAVRQPGSTVKPLLYYAALEQGFTPSTMMRSEPTTFKFQDGQPDYAPHNYNSQYANEEITLAQALALSDNVIAVKTHLFLGEEVLIDTAKRFGIASKMAKVPSLALGTSGVRVIEMANAYSHFANGGKEVDPIFITRVENFQGDIIYENQSEHKQVLQPEQTYVMTQMLTGIFDSKLNGYASVTGSTMIKSMTRPYAGKSGTTNSDNWMIGYSPQLVTAVWTGYDSGKAIYLTVDKTYAKNIWIHFMEDSLKNEPIKNFKRPKNGVIGVYVNPANGKLASKECPVKRFTYFVAGTEPTDYCTDHLTNTKQTNSKHKEAPKKKPWYKKIWDWN
ncbi:transglycosylase domain-containing protein [Neobacillus sp. D3-1R]|uniref:transglycosylase domain-containing protein n=1 Tax=Neobacillus sp. D3-1R TaxID=3445778 RepID=UPI003FA113FC